MSIINQKLADLPWADFKALVDSSQLAVKYVETAEKYYIKALDAFFEVCCMLEKTDPENSDQADFEANYKPTANIKSNTSVETRFERTDLDLKVCHIENTVDTETGIVCVTIACPGTAGSGDGRYLAGGEFFFDVAHAGDSITAINVVDVDNILGLGANTVVKTYHDSEVAEANQGWHIPPKFGHISIETLGFYGFLPSGLYLKIYAQKATGYYSGKAYCNIFWGKSS